MARAGYTYVVEHPNPFKTESPHVVAVFTVKYELMRWVLSNHNSEYTYYRIPFDWDKQTPICINKEVLIWPMYVN